MLDSIIDIRRFGAVLGLTTLLLSAPPSELAAQVEHRSDIHGRVISAEDASPLVATSVRILELGRNELTHQGGDFHFERVPAGTYTLLVERLGFRPRYVEVTVEADRTVDVEIDLETSPLDLQGLVVSGSPTARASGDVIRPVNVLSGEELTRRLDGTVASTLTSEPGLAATTMGPATARPVIRGLGGDRVLVLEDGERTGDVSSISSDHATAVDPVSAQRIEVVRGPAALLYGSQALGGVVNVIREEIPRNVPDRLTGQVSLQGQTVSEGVVLSGSGIVPIGEEWALRVEGSRRRGGDLATPEGDLGNTDVRTWNAAAGLGWVLDQGDLGATYRYFRNEYGIPGGFVGAHPTGVDIEMERHVAKGEGRIRSVGPFEELTASASWTRYHHTELEVGGIVGTEYGLVTHALEATGRHGGSGVWAGGTVGARFQRERFGYGGSLSTPDTRRWTGSAYLFEELSLDELSLEGGLRYDRIRTDVFDADPDSDIGVIRDRSFDAFSWSLGALYRLPGDVSVGASLARAFRAPDVNELYSEGPHLASYSFEVGNPDLGTEVGTGADLFVRVERDRVQAELTAFANDIDGYLYPRETGDTSRVRLPIYQFTGADARLVGLEGGASVSVTDRWVVDGTASWVRGTLTDEDRPLPLIPPLNGRLGVRYESPGWFGGVELRAATEQDRLGEFETTTDGYAVLDLSAGVRFDRGGRLHTISARLDNALDETWRNHLSRTKEIMPEAGRGLSVVYRVVF